MGCESRTPHPVGVTIIARSSCACRVTAAQTSSLRRTVMTRAFLDRAPLCTGGRESLPAAHHRAAPGPAPFAPRRTHRRSRPPQPSQADTLTSVDHGHDRRAPPEQWMIFPTPHLPSVIISTPAAWWRPSDMPASSKMVHVPDLCGFRHGRRCPNIRASETAAIALIEQGTWVKTTIDEKQLDELAK